MLKKSKKILSLTCCLIIAFSTTIFANPNVEKKDVMNASEETPIASFTVSVYKFTYENAPQSVKEEYEKKCAELNETPLPGDEIYIPVDIAQEYNIPSYRAASDFHIDAYYNSHFEVTGAKNYTVNMSTTVGYGYTTSGNPVHLCQLILYKLGYSVSIDSKFGSSTYSKVKSYQSSSGLSSDGIVGRGTWNSMASDLI